jgi:hypothetical protein
VIVVVEGPSAAGKTSWLARWPPDEVIPEHGRVVVPPDRFADEAVFWSEMNAARWAQALAVEARAGHALCDGDPLKLSYDYCLARIGELPWSRFDSGVAACSEAIRDRRLGIADAIFCSIPDEATLAARRAGDTSRRRRNFDVNRRLGPALADWYRALDDIDPGRVHWAFPEQVPVGIPGARYDDGLFARWMARLPRPSTPPR